MFSSGEHRTATEILAREIMFVSPDANRDRLLKHLSFSANGLLENWDLGRCKIAKLPESCGDVMCTGDLDLQGNRLESLPLSFGTLSVGGGLILYDNNLRCLPPNFEQIRVGGNLFLDGNPELTGIPTEFPNVKGKVYRP